MGAIRGPAGSASRAVPAQELRGSLLSGSLWLPGQPEELTERLGYKVFVVWLPSLPPRALRVNC